MTSFRVATYRHLSIELHSASINHGDMRRMQADFPGTYSTRGIDFYGGLEAMYRAEWEATGAKDAKWDSPLPADAQERIARYLNARDLRGSK